MVGVLVPHVRMRGRAHPSASDRYAAAAYPDRHAVGRRRHCDAGTSHACGDPLGHDGAHAYPDPHGGAATVRLGLRGGNGAADC